MSYLFPARSITFDAALRDLANGSPQARVAAANSLGDVTEPTERRRAIEALLAAIEDDKPEVRAEACSALGTLGEGSGSGEAAAGIVAAIAKRLGDGSAGVRQNAAIALGTLKHPAGFAPLAEALAEGPAELRFQAVTSLAEIDGARAYEPAIAALDDSDPQVVAAAALALGGIGDKRAIPAIAAKLEIADVGARFDVAYGLAELDDASGRAALAAALADPDRAWDAASALGWLGTAGDVHALVLAMRARKTPAEASVLAAGVLLGLGESVEAAKVLLLEALTNRRAHIRGIAVEQLALHGGAWALGPLDKLVRSSKGDELREAISAAIRAITTRHVDR